VEQENWSRASQRMILLDPDAFQSYGFECSAILSLDLDLVPVTPFPELFRPHESPVLMLTQGMDPDSYPYGLNGGVISFTPAKNLYAEAVKFSTANPNLNEQHVYGKLSWHEKLWLSYVYNMSPANCFGNGFSDKQVTYVKIWHFTWGDKPWEAGAIDRATKCDKSGAVESAILKITQCYELRAKMGMRVDRTP